MYASRHRGFPISRMPDGCYVLRPPLNRGLCDHRASVRTRQSPMDHSSGIAFSIRAAPISLLGGAPALAHSRHCGVLRRTDGDSHRASRGPSYGPGHLYSDSIQTWAMTANPFFSPVVRIQHEHGHRLIDSGPYRFVRHPGYLAMCIAAPASAAAIGSWAGLFPATQTCSG